jgi:sulfane dehydrogenase subunit SoxC
MFLRPAFAAEGGATFPGWMREPGASMSAYGQPSPFSKHVTRTIQSFNIQAPEEGASMTPYHLLKGVTTPNGLHFERHHSGVPNIDPAQHRLTIHGLVRQPLSFAYEDLLRYPMTSRQMFLECSGNSWRNTFDEPHDETAGVLNGLLSTSEWTGIPLSTLLDEAGIDAAAKWIVAEGGDAAKLNRSLPLSKVMDDVILALYQNGEPIRPEQGFPMRLFAPGYEGNVSVKWLRSIQVTDQPAQTRWETSKYTDLMPDGSAEQFSFEMGVKSFIASPSGKMALQENGVYEISGLAWSGAGAITKVDVSADGGASWATTLLDEPGSALKPVRFRLPWRWSGGPALLQSRATDAAGNIQPTRKKALARFHPRNIYHFNGFQSWSVSAEGGVKNAFA